MAYIEKHGPHFTECLAEYASKQMENANGKEHTWKPSEVKMALSEDGLKIPGHATLGDVTYVANMAYADFSLKDDLCMKLAYDTANDPDGYDGMIFNRWLSDILGKGVNINWREFI